MNPIKQISTVVFFLLVSAAAHAEPLILEETMQGNLIGKYLDVYRVPSGSVKAPDGLAEFTPQTIKKGSPGFGFTSDELWAKITVQNPFPEDKQIYFEIGYAMLDTIEIFRDKENSPLYTVGDIRPFQERPVLYRNPIFPLEVAPDSSETFWFHVKTQSSLNFPLYIWDPLVFLEKVNSQQIILGMSYGILFIMVLYNLSLFVFTRELSYIYYSFFVASYSLFLFNLNGIAFEFLWPSFPAWGNISLPPLIALASGFGALFAVQFLNLKMKLPKLARAMTVLGYIYFTLSFIELFLPYGIAIKMSTAGVLLMAFFLFYAPIRSLLTGYKPARYFLTAWTFLILGFFMYAAKSFGLLPNTFITTWSLQIGAVLEVFLLSVALADKINQLKQENERTWASLNKAYGRFVPHAFLGFLEKKNILEVDLGNQVAKKMSVLFCDIRNFTTMSENLTPEENFAFINEYLNRVVPAVHLNQGVVDKYIGDAIMALFPGSPDTAVQAAIDIQNTIQLYNDERKARGDEPIRVGIGIHMGDLMLGTIGTPEHMQGSVIADAVNLASRLEEMTKLVGADILISSQTMYNLEKPEDFKTRFLGQIRVKGKQENIAIFEVLDALPHDQLQRRIDLKKDFRQGVEAFFEHKYEQAQALFHRLFTECPEDRAVAGYLKRIEKKLGETKHI